MVYSVMQTYPTQANGYPNPNIHHLWSTKFWDFPWLTDAQLSQPLEFRHNHCMGNARKALMLKSDSTSCLCQLCPQQHNEI